ncbi:uncharacterized protein [Apostichopus japonicus]|uniref:uncharacterized protein n=1 Tax=Stichopus japonicus TaxID=307972 RepID=UPI003AB83518
MEASVDNESPMKSKGWAFQPIYPLVDTNIIEQREAAMAEMEAAPIGSAITGPPSPPSTTKLTPLKMTSEAVWVGGQVRPRTSPGTRIGQESGIDSPSTSTTGPNGPQEMKGASDSGMASFLKVSPLVSDGEVEPQPDVMTYLPSFSTPNLFKPEKNEGKEKKKKKKKTGKKSKSKSDIDSILSLLSDLGEEEDNGMQLKEDNDSNLPLEEKVGEITSMPPREDTSPLPEEPLSSVNNVKNEEESRQGNSCNNVNMVTVDSGLPCPASHPSPTKVASQPLGSLKSLGFLKPIIHVSAIVDRVSPTLPPLVSSNRAAFLQAPLKPIGLLQPLEKQQSHNLTLPLPLVKKAPCQLNPLHPIETTLKNKNQEEITQNECRQIQESSDIKDDNSAEVVSEDEDFVMDEEISFSDQSSLPDNSGQVPEPDLETGFEESARKQGDLEQEDMKTLDVEIGEAIDTSSVSHTLSTSYFYGNNDECCSSETSNEGISCCFSRDEDAADLEEVEHETVNQENIPILPIVQSGVCPDNPKPEHQLADCAKPNNTVIAEGEKSEEDMYSDSWTGGSDQSSEDSNDDHLDNDSCNSEEESVGRLSTILEECKDYISEEGGSVIDEPSDQIKPAEDRASDQEESLWDDETDQSSDVSENNTQDIAEAFKSDDTEGGKTGDNVSEIEESDAGLSTILEATEEEYSEYESAKEAVIECEEEALQKASENNLVQADEEPEINKATTQSVEESIPEEISFEDISAERDAYSVNTDRLSDASDQIFYNGNGEDCMTKKPTATSTFEETDKVLQKETAMVTDKVLQERNATVEKLELCKAPLTSNGDCAEDSCIKHAHENDQSNHKPQMTGIFDAIEKVLQRETAQIIEQVLKERREKLDSAERLPTGNGDNGDNACKSGCSLFDESNDCCISKQSGSHQSHRLGPKGSHDEHYSSITGHFFKQFNRQGNTQNESQQSTTHSQTDEQEKSSTMSGCSLFGESHDGHISMLSGRQGKALSGHSQQPTSHNEAGKLDDHQTASSISKCSHFDETDKCQSGKQSSKQEDNNWEKNIPKSHSQDEYSPDQHQRSFSGSTSGRFFSDASQDNHSRNQSQRQEKTPDAQSCLKEIFSEGSKDRIADQIILSVTQQNQSKESCHNVTISTVPEKNLKVTDSDTESMEGIPKSQLSYDDNELDATDKEMPEIGRLTITNLSSVLDGISSSEKFSIKEAFIQAWVDENTQLLKDGQLVNASEDYSEDDSEPISQMEAKEDQVSICNHDSDHSEQLGTPLHNKASEDKSGSWVQPAVSSSDISIPSEGNIKAKSHISCESEKRQDKSDQDSELDLPLSQVGSNENKSNMNGTQEQIHDEKKHAANVVKDDSLTLQCNSSRTTHPKETFSMTGILREEFAKLQSLCNRMEGHKQQDQHMLPTPPVTPTSTELYHRLSLTEQEIREAKVEVQKLKVKGINHIAAKSSLNSQLQKSIDDVNKLNSKPLSQMEIERGKVQVLEENLGDLKNEMKKWKIDHELQLNMMEKKYQFNEIKLHTDLSLAKEECTSLKLDNEVNRQKYEKSLTDLTNQNQKLETIMDHLKKKLHLAEKEVTAKHKAIQSWQAAYGKMATSVTEVQESSKLMSDMMKKQDRKMQLIFKQLSTSNDKVSKLEADLTRSLEERCAVETLRDLSQLNLEAMKEEMLKMKEQFQVIAAQNDKELLDLRNQIQQNQHQEQLVRGELTDKETFLKNLEQKADVLKVQVNKLEIEHKLKDNQIYSFEQQIAKSQKVETALKKKSVELMDRLTEITTSNEALKAEKYELSRRVAELESRFSCQTQHATLVTQQLADSQNDVEKLDGLLKVARTEITQLNQSFQEVQKQLKEKEIAHHHSDSLISSLEEELRCLKDKEMKRESLVHDKEPVSRNTVETDLKRAEHERAEIMLQLNDLRTHIVDADINQSQKDVIKSLKNEVTILKAYLAKKIEKLYSAELLAEERASIIKKLKLRERKTLERMKLISDSEDDEIKIRAEVRREFSRKLQEKKKKLKNECALERKSMLDKINCLKLQVKDLQMKDAKHFYQIDNKRAVKMDFEQSCCRETEAPKNLFKSSG